MSRAPAPKQQTQHEMAPKKAALVDASNELVNAAVPDAPPAKAAKRKQKTNRAAVKRFSVTSTGKLLRHYAGALRC